MTEKLRTDWKGMAESAQENVDRLEAHVRDLKDRVDAQKARIAAAEQNAAYVIGEKNRLEEQVRSLELELAQMRGWMMRVEAVEEAEACADRMERKHAAHYPFRHHVSPSIPMSVTAGTTDGERYR